jgi:hypothetical protein
MKSAHPSAFFMPRYCCKRFGLFAWHVGMPNIYANRKIHLSANKKTPASKQSRRWVLHKLCCQASFI